MNFQLQDDEGVTIQQNIEGAHLELELDIVGFWGIVSEGRQSFHLGGGDLREYVLLYVLSLVASGAIVIDGAVDGVHTWAKIDRYGTKPKEIAHNVTAEWIDMGEPDPPAWETIAFSLPSYLGQPENRRDWPKPKDNEDIACG